MKITYLLLASGLLLASSAHAQTASCDCDYLKSEIARVKAENAFLRKNAGKSITVPPPALANAAGLTAAEPQTQTGENIAYTLVSCIGDRKAQTVTIQFLLKNSGATRDLQFLQLVAIDGSGEQHQTYNVGFGTTQRSSVPTGIAVKAAAVVAKVLPSVSSFAIVTLSSYKQDVGPGKNVELVYRDVPINWK
jgi:hypothetical protein